MLLKEMSPTSQKSLLDEAITDASDLLHRFSLCLNLYNSIPSGPKRQSPRYNQRGDVTYSKSPEIPETQEAEQLDSRSWNQYRKHTTRCDSSDSVIKTKGRGLLVV